MTLIEALKSGKRFRRQLKEWVGPAENLDKSYHFSKDHCMAEDWEIEKTPEVYKIECCWHRTEDGFTYPSGGGIPFSSLIGKKTRLRIEVIE